jgi:hypothetical protein
MFQELLHFFSFILCAAGLGVTLIGAFLSLAPFTTCLIRHKFQAAFPFLLMTLGGLLAGVIGWKGINSIPTPKTLEIQAPADSVIRAEVIRNGHVIHQEEI